MRGRIHYSFDSDPVLIRVYPLLERVFFRRELHIPHRAPIFSPQIKAKVENIRRYDLLKRREALRPEEAFSLSHPSVVLMVPDIPQELVYKPLLLAQIRLRQLFVEVEDLILAFC